jgi:hypothetical protein
MSFILYANTKGATIITLLMGEVWQRKKKPKFVLLVR